MLSISPNHKKSIADKLKELLVLYAPLVESVILKKTEAPEMKIQKDR